MSMRVEQQVAFKHIETPPRSSPKRGGKFGISPKRGGKFGIFLRGEENLVSS
jgi:hypothetical protein